MTPFEKLSRSLTGYQPNQLVNKIAGGVGGTPTGTKDNPLIIEVDGQAQTILQWSRQLRIPLATLRYRYLAGWPPAQILGREPRPRNRTAEQATLTKSALVVIFDEGGQPMTRRDAAAYLKVQPRSLAQRLRNYRVPGRQNTVRILDLYVGSRLEAAGGVGGTPHRNEG